MRGLCAAVVASCFVAAGVFAQCPGRFVSTAGQEFAGVNGSVKVAVEWEGATPEGSLLVVGGTFSLAGRAAASNIAAWDGVSWRALGDGLPGAVYAVVVADGALYAVCDYAFGSSHRYLKRWDGMAWRTVRDDLELTEALAVLGREVLFKRQNTVMAYGGTGSRTLGGSLGSPPIHLAVVSGELYAGLDNDTVVHWDGAVWQGVPFPGPARIDRLFGSSNELIAAGSFGQAGGGYTNVMRWDGASWRATNFSNYPPASFAEIGGELYACYSSATARWNGSAWVDPGFIAPGNLMGLAEFRGGLIGIGGQAHPAFFHIDRIASYEAGAWQKLGSGLGPDWATGLTVRAVETVGDDLYIGGSFQQDFPVPLNAVARRVGDHWEQLGAGLCPHSRVNGLQADTDGLLVMGDFACAGGIDARNIAEWTGTEWRAFGAGLGEPLRGVYAAARWNGRLYAGGTFMTSGGLTVRRVGAWDGSAWSEVGGGLDGGVSALVEHQGLLVAAGGFTGTNLGVSLSSIAGWDGAAWRPLGAGLKGSVSGLVVFEGELYAGGAIKASGDEPIAGVAKWDGVRWSQLGLLAPDGVTSVTVTALGLFQGQLYASGQYCPAGGGCVKFIRRWADGLWRPIGPGRAYAVDMVEHQGRLEVVGPFVSVGGVAGNCQGTYELAAAVEVSAATAEQPANVGESVVMRATVVASAPFNCLWRLNGEPTTSLITAGAATGVPTAYEVVLTIPSFGWRSVGVYDVNVLDACGAVHGAGVYIVPRSGCSMVDIGRSGGVEGGDQRLDNNDLVVFVDWFMNGDSRADFGMSGGWPYPDGNLDSTDFVVFIDRFFAGCG